MLKDIEAFDHKGTEGEDKKLLLVPVRTLIVVVIVAILLLITVVSLLTYFNQIEPIPPLGSPTPTPLSSPRPTPSIEGLIIDITERSPKPEPVYFEKIARPTPKPVTLITDSGVEWFDEPSEISDAENRDILKSDNAQYYRFYYSGNDNGRKIYVGLIGEIGASVYILRETATGYESMHTLTEYEYSLFTDKVTQGNFSYQSLTTPEKLTVNGVTYTKAISFGANFFESPNTNETNDAKLVGYTPWGPLYQTDYSYPDIPGLHANYFAIRLANGISAPFQIANSSTDDSVPAVTWSDGTKNTNAYRSGTTGCGGGTINLIADFDIINGHVFNIGTLANGTPIYDFIDPQDPIIMKFYSETRGNFYSQPGLTLSEFLKLHGTYVMRDAEGRFIVYENTIFAPQAECGKPVIYLYPETTTAVSVLVGADITKSEPLYTNGWNVIAEPNGTLTTTEGQSYDSLFWEGYGHGLYPQHVSQYGFVVRQSDIESTLRLHLSQLGLNKKEAQDFLDFWLDHMPDTPYIRLTWLGTEHMNALAPLTVSPQPDTSIRIFLDFEGLENPIALQPQKLTAPTRKGFTLIEWGGLLVK